MKKHRDSLWLILLVLPLCVISLFAWRGMMNTKAVRWQRVKTDAEATVKNRVQFFDERIFSHAEILPRFSLTPQPLPDGVNLPSKSASVNEIRDWREKNRDTWTLSGLPVNVVAYLLIDEAQRTEQEKHEIVQLAMNQPSFLTEKVLSGDDLKNWQRKLHLMELGSHATEAGSWVQEGKLWHWMQMKDGHLNFIDGNQLYEQCNDDEMFVSADELKNLSKTHNILASAQLPVGDNLFFAVALSQARVNALVKDFSRGMSGLLGSLISAFILSFISIYMMHNAVKREKKVHQMKSDFVASVTHELRAPIGSIRLMADGLKEHRVDEVTQNKFYELIAREGERLSRLIENVLDFSRIEEGKQKWHFAEIEMTSLLSSVCEIMQPLANEKHISLQLSAAAPCIVAADSAAIQQAMVNLLDNAIKFSPSDHAVKITLTTEQDAWSVAISDRGKGIPRHEQERVFEKFVRLENELVRKTQGTGIGLCVVRAIAEGHGGTAYVKESSEQGTTIIFTAKINPV